MSRRRPTSRLPDTSFETSPFAKDTAKLAKAPSVEDVGRAFDDLSLDSRSPPGKARTDRTREPSAANFTDKALDDLLFRPYSPGEQARRANRARRHSLSAVAPISARTYPLAPPDGYQNYDIGGLDRPLGRRSPNTTHDPSAARSESWKALGRGIASKTKSLREKLNRRVDISKLDRFMKVRPGPALSFGSSGEHGSSYGPYNIHGVRHPDASLPEASRPSSPASSCSSANFNRARDPWQPPKPWRKGAKFGNAETDSSDDEVESTEPRCAVCKKLTARFDTQNYWQDIIRGMDAKHARSKKEIKAIKENIKRTEARIRAMDVDAPYSIRKAHHQKQERDRKRAEEAIKKGISWQRTALTWEERDHTIKYETYVLEGGRHVPQYEELVKKYYS